MPIVKIFKEKILVKFTIISTILLFFQLGCGVNNENGGKNKNDDHIQYLGTKHSWEPGNVFTQDHGWVKVSVGDMPFVISIPHGGTIMPPYIPDRTCPGITTVNDGLVDELATAIKQRMKEEYGVQPYVVYGLISRKKIDFNRNLNSESGKNATCGNKIMNNTWHVYHRDIQKALSKAVKKYGYALFIDLHGHAGEDRGLELGYSVTAKQIGEMYLYPQKARDIGKESSLANLVKMKKKLDIRHLIWGKNSFGSLIFEKGYRAVPSKNKPYPVPSSRTENSYFDGGYTSRIYTSNSYPHVFGWQIETNYKGVRTHSAIPKSSKALAEAIMAFLKKNIDYNPPTK